MVSAIGKEINTFVAVCESLLSPTFMANDLSQKESHAIQFYLAALRAKFPALVD